MSIGIGQILLILLVIVILFGKLPNVFQDIASGIKTIKDVVDNNQEKKDENQIEKIEDRKIDKNEIKKH